MREDCSLSSDQRILRTELVSVFERLCSSIRHIRVVLLRDEVSKTICTKGVKRLNEVRNDLNEVSETIE